MSILNYEVLIKEGEYQKVVDEASYILENKPSNSYALEWKSKALYKLGKFKLAIESYSILIQVTSIKADFYADRALCYHMLGDEQSALLDFNKAIDLEPKNAYRYSCRAFVKDYYKDFQGALADYNKAIELDPNDAITHNNKGVLEEKLGFAEQAKESFDASNELQGIDLEKELAKINVSDLPPITLPKQESKKLSFKDYLNVLKLVFTTKKGLFEFTKFIFPKK